MLKNLFLIFGLFLPFIGFSYNKIIELDSFVIEEFEWILCDSNKIYGKVDTFKSTVVRNYYNKEMISNENVLFIFDEKENLLSLEFENSLIKKFIFMGHQHTVSGYKNVN